MYQHISIKFYCKVNHGWLINFGIGFAECIPSLCLCFAPLFLCGLQQNLWDYEEIRRIMKKSLGL